MSMKCFGGGAGGPVGAAIVGLSLLWPAGDAIAGREDISSDRGAESGACSSLLYSVEPQHGSFDFDPRDPTSPDLSVCYFITAEDAPSLLCDATLDDIAFLTLHGEAPIDLSALEVYVTPDWECWTKVAIVEHGIWQPGSTITIAERATHHVVPRHYMIQIQGNSKFGTVTYFGAL